ncbi:esterase-like activity of phytase family protein [Cronobacter sakazakii]|uniref:esterase-like activity of phytase family protein n=1 Tax=Cronobacter sakazakii TaxID=28141 RepID=UPI000CFC57C4|nr:esterase-like activity of phytase family protein [Cronobacter sakazakii]EGT4353924.1 esterase-like activity of phytase family protein [Cronobacter sakazakii]EJH8724793.1 esterase-like activity of phytase family protein [Cronobacter sakazakii]EJJ0563498.1 esterase-like activity of phytase family protein [Cronobacter sakazakii]EJJ0567926.1 esterase-like activity of phytase family protein [Cronobacter sakazakii]EKK4737729.1 esterase-like activity of phytase family protein [Cronobacter sakazaki
MKIKPLTLAFAALFPLCSLAAAPQVERYVVTFPQEDHVVYSGNYASAFPDGLPVGVGSGLLFLRKEGDDLIFATVTDRGPNADSPKMGKQESKIFASPEYTPLMMTIRVSKDQAQASDPMPLHDDKGNISGLPLPAGLIGATNELALNDALQTLTGDKRGLDTEGITPDGKGGYWLCDEYGPFIIHVDASGAILAKHGPQADKGEEGVAGGLPNIIKWRQPNRGFEGLTRMPDGRIIAAVQSTLDIDGKTKNTARFTRLVSFDPATGKTAMYGYPIDIDVYKKAKDAKIGDIVALDDHRILLIEQGGDKNKTMRNRVYVVDLSNATDLSTLDKTEPPEFDDAEKLSARGVKLATKQLAVDLRELGWQQEKAEGLALIDPQTLAVINDNDFGLQSELLEPQGDKKEMDDYNVDGQGHLTLDGKPVASKIGIKPLEKPASQNELWVIKLDKPL